MRPRLNAEQVATMNNEKVRIHANFRDKDGVIWHYVPLESNTWPNGNPHRAVYRTAYGGKLVVWLNEVGQLIYAQYA